MSKLPWLAVPLALAAVPAAAQVVVSPAVPLPDGTVLEVSAEGRVERVPDVATVRAGVVTQAPTAAAAVADNAARMTRVLAALKAAGIAARDLSTAAVSLQPQYRYAENQPPVVTGYQATNTVAVRFRDVSRSGRVLDALVGAGANQIDGPSLALDKPDEALDAARADAVARARARAELYARAAGLKVERIATITEAGEDAGGQPQPPVAFRVRAAAADAAPTQLLAGETAVTVRLQVRFVLRP
jgi:uncharacterized protein